MCYKKLLLILTALVFTAIVYAKYPYDGRNLYTAKQEIYSMPENQPFTLVIDSNIPVTAHVEIKPKDSGQATWWNRYSFTPFQTHININSSTPPNEAGWYVQVTVLYDYNTNRNPQVNIQKIDN